MAQETEFESPAGPPTPQTLRDVARPPVLDRAKTHPQLRLRPFALEEAAHRRVVLRSRPGPASGGRPASTSTRCRSHSRVSASTSSGSPSGSPERFHPRHRRPAHHHKAGRGHQIRGQHHRLRTDRRTQPHRRAHHRDHLVLTAVEVHPVTWGAARSTAATPSDHSQHRDRLREPDAGSGERPPGRGPSTTRLAPSAPDSADTAPGRARGRRQPARAAARAHARDVRGGGEPARAPVPGVGAVN
jgi:hypothetical protein